MTIPKDTKKVYGRQTTERLRLLEAVAEACGVDARIQVDYMGGRGMTFTEYLAQYGDPMRYDGHGVLEALAALEAYDD